jgi:hypothetical protein
MLLVMIVGALVRQQKLLLNERGESNLYRGYVKNRNEKKRASLASDRPCSMYSKTGALPSGCFQATTVTALLGGSEPVVSVALKPGI